MLFTSKKTLTRGILDEKCSSILILDFVERTHDHIWDGINAQKDVLQPSQQIQSFSREKKAADKINVLCKTFK